MGNTIQPRPGGKPINHHPIPAIGKNISSPAIVCPRAQDCSVFCLVKATQRYSGFVQPSIQDGAACARATCRLIVSSTPLSSAARSRCAILHTAGIAGRTSYATSATDASTCQTCAQAARTRHRHLGSERAFLGHAPAVNQARRPTNASNLVC